MVGLPGKHSEHTAGIGDVGRLSEHNAVANNHGVGCDNELIRRY